MNRACRLQPTIKRIMAVDLAAWSLAEPELDPEQLRPTHGYNRGAGGRTLSKDGHVPFDVVDNNRGSDVGQRLGVSVDERFSVQAVEDRGVWDGIVRNLGHLDVQPLCRLFRQRQSVELGPLNTLHLLYSL